MKKLFYRVDELAKIFRCHEKTVYRMLADGKLPFIRIGKLKRIPVSAVENYIEQEYVKSSEETGTVWDSDALLSLDPTA